MDWDRIKQQWTENTPAVPDVSIDKLRRQDEKLRRRVKWRDRIETAAAVLVALWFAFTTVGLAVGGKWVGAGFALLLVTWAVLMPLWLRRTRRQVPEPEPHLPLMENLARQRDAALAQARMLEQVWLWYLGPPLVGLVGLTLATRGLSTFALVYLPGVLVLYVAIGWVNRRTARLQFRAHAERLQRQIDAVSEEGEP
ncbi:hypothetical protein [Luteimonas sp. A478]